MAYTPINVIGRSAQSTCTIRISVHNLGADDCYIFTITVQVKRYSGHITTGKQKTVLNLQHENE